MYLNRTIFHFSRGLILLGISVFLYSSSFAINPVSYVEKSVNFSSKEIKFPKDSLLTLNRDQLVQLVDHLLEMDSIPAFLMNEVKKAVTNLINFENEKMMAENSIKTEVPSSEYYSSWETNKLFPEKDCLQLKRDSSTTLDLKAYGHVNYINPINGVITSNFGWRDSTQHKGIDIGLKWGDKVVAALDGMVRFASRSGGYGNVIIIRHYNGLETVYAHLSKIKVKPGQIISAGQLIGLGGNTGHTTGPHLHFEVRFKGVAINPKYLISFSDDGLLCDKLVIKMTKWGLAAFPKDEKVYTIEKGDTLYEIAKRFGVSTSSLKQLNGMSGYVRLKAGQIINVAQ